MSSPRTRTHSLPLALLLASLLPLACNHEGPSAKDEMKGKVVFSQGEFEDAKKYKTFDEFKRAHQLVSELNVAVPGVGLKYYAVFQEPLNNAKQYVVEVFDKTENTTAHSEHRDIPKEGVGQIAGGWSFEIPVWPIPEDPTKLVSNDVWIKPGHQYEVMILKPLASGEFSVASAPTPVATPTPKGKATAKGPSKKKTR